MQNSNTEHRYADASCSLVDTSDTSQSVCDTAIGFYTLLRFNHLQGPIALQQFRLKSELDSASEVSCPEPYVVYSSAKRENFNHIPQILRVSQCYHYLLKNYEHRLYNSNMTSNVVKY